MSLMTLLKRSPNASQLPQAVDVVCVLVHATSLPSCSRNSTPFSQLVHNVGQSYLLTAAANGHGAHNGYSGNRFRARKLPRNHTDQRDWNLSATPCMLPARYNHQARISTAYQRYAVVFGVLFDPWSHAHGSASLVVTRCCYRTARRPPGTRIYSK
jgi:hypothetical protein